MANATVLRYRPDDRPFWRDDKRPAVVDASCAAANARFSADDDAWSADTLLAEVAARRRGLRVPFYLYDDASGASMNATELLAHFANCQHKAPGRFGKVREQPWFVLEVRRAWTDHRFIASLLDHPWRTRTPEEAAILVIPLLLTFELLAQGECGHPSVATMRHVERGALWKKRARDHLVVSLGFHVKFDRLPNSVWSSLDGNVLWGHYELKNMISPRSNNTKLVVPYTNSPIGAPVTATTRDVDVFFGGGTFPGFVNGPWARPGYALRWDMFEQLRRTTERQICTKAPGGCVTARRQVTCVICRWVPRARHLSLHEGRDAARILLVASDIPSDLPEAFTREVAPCPPMIAPLERGVTACRGHFDAIALMRRAEFVLYVRGDTPTTSRLQEALVAGALPIIVSDQLFRVGLAFPCFVPYRRFLVEVPERQIHADAPRALLDVLNQTRQPRRRRMRETLGAMARDLLWDFPGSRVVDNVLLEAARLRGKLPGVCCFEDARPAVL